IHLCHKQPEGKWPKQQLRFDRPALQLRHQESRGYRQPLRGPLCQATRAILTFKCTIDFEELVQTSYVHSYMYILESVLINSLIQF
uniref:Uncharacterized protein n=1 Tax=Piliocolobus tephrosceles TaxID=591936 RepID=A0A8C9GP86_9PRIM